MSGQRASRWRERPPGFSSPSRRSSAQLQICLPPPCAPIGRSLSVPAGDLVVLPRTPARTRPPRTQPHRRRSWLARRSTGCTKAEARTSHRAAVRPGSCLTGRPVARSCARSQRRCVSARLPQPVPWLVATQCTRPRSCAGRPRATRAPARRRWPQRGHGCRQPQTQHGGGRSGGARLPVGDPGAGRLKRW
jgi:hypothetical protein